VRLGTSESATLTELVERARHGDENAWRALVGRLERVVWKAVNMSTDDPQVRLDAAAATWLRLAENLQAIRDPERLPGWMVTTARREVIAHFRRNRLVPDDRMLLREDPATESDPAERVEESDLREALRTAFRRLSMECQELLTLLVLADPPLSYDAVEAQLGRPRGSLGPTRARCLDRLRHMPELRHHLDPQVPR
jgi:RNA polymerase sigma factor (sigma-70 family)